MQKQQKPASTTPKDAREERLQAALRANLKRRKKATPPKKARENSE